MVSVCRNGLAGLFLFLMATAALAQMPVTYSISTKDGLPSNSVYDIFQDKEGFMWFGTDNGVARFDGARFQNFSIVDGLPDNEIFVVQGDSRGRIWFLCSNGKVAFYQKGKIHSPVNTPFLREIDPKTWFTSLVEDRFRNIWLTGYTGATFRIRNDTIVHPFTQSPYSYLPGGRVTSELTLDKDSLAWIVTQGGAICLSVDPMRVILYKEIDNSALEKALFIPEDGFVTISQKNILHFHKNGQIDTFPKPFPNNTQTVTRLPNGDIWFCTLKEAIRYPGGNFRQTPVHYFTGNTIGRVRGDRSGNIWIGTNNRGVLLVPFLDRVHYSGFLQKEKEIFSLYRDPKNRIWMGGDNGQITLWDGKTVERLEVPPHLNTKGRGRIRSIQKFRDDTTVVVYEECLLLYKEKIPVRTAWVNSKASLPFRGRYWVGFSTNCYAFPQKVFEEICSSDLSPDGSQIYSFTYQARPYTGFLLGGRVFDLTYDDWGRVWIGMGSGLVGVRNSNLSVVSLPDTGILWNKPILALARFSGQKILLGIQSYGLGIFDTRTFKMELIPALPHFESGIIRRIVPDGNRYWICTSMGLFEFRQTNGRYSVRKVSLQQGQVSLQVNDVLPGKDFLYVGGDAGLSLVPVSELASSPEAVPAPFNLTLEKDNEILEKKEATFEDNPGVLKIRFGYPSYRYFGKVSFRYRLRLQDPWVEISEFEILLQNLAPGYYRPEIQARNPSSAWSPSAFLPAFEIEPPLWKQAWFLVVVLLTTILITALVAGIIIRSRLEAVTLEHQLTEANLRALRAQIKPHFLFNAINSVQHFFLFNQKEEGLEFLGRFSMLMRKILEGSEKQFHRLEDELLLIQDYLEIEKERIGPGLHVHLEVDPHLSETPIPTMLLQPLAENALWHGIMKNRDKSGSVWIRARVAGFDGYAETRLRIEVEDNGPGRSPVQKEPSKGGFGLRSLNNKIDLLNKKYHKAIQLFIVDKSDEQGNPSGTLVVLNLPLHWQHDENKDPVN